MSYILKSPRCLDLLVKVNFTKSSLSNHYGSKIYNLKSQSSKIYHLNQQRKCGTCSRKNSFIKTISSIDFFLKNLKNDSPGKSTEITSTMTNIVSMIFSKFKERAYRLSFQNGLEFKPDVSHSIMFFNIKHMFQDKFFSKQVVTKTEKTPPKEELEENWGGPNAFKLIIFIQEDFDGIINKHSSVLVFFSASWCQHCLKLRKPYGRAAVMAKEANLPIVFATFDVTINPDIADEKGVVGIPILKYYKNGKFISNFKGKRTAEDIFEFAKNPPKPTVEPKKADV